MRPQNFRVGDARAAEAGRKGALARAVETKQQALGRIALQYVGDHVGALSAAYDQGYKAGNCAKMRAVRGRR